MENKFDCKNFEELYAKIDNLRKICEDQAIKISGLSSRLVQEKQRSMYLESKVNFLNVKLEELNEENLMMKEKLDNFYFERGR